MKIPYVGSNPPVQAHPLDAGSDIRSAETAVLAPGQMRLFKTELSIQLPPDCVGMMCSRSGLGLKHNVIVLNSPGIIDAGYRGELGVGLMNLSQVDFEVTKGMRIAQLVVVKYEQAEWVQVDEGELCTKSVRGTGGYGSSGLM